MSTIGRHLEMSGKDTNPDVSVPYALKIKEKVLHLYTEITLDS